MAGSEWARLDSTYPSHPKILRVGPIGELIHMRAICYAARHLTDGLIPTEALPGLYVGLDKLRLTEGTKARGHLKLGREVLKVDWPSALIAAGLWEVCAGGWQLHDYLQHNPSRQEYEQMLDSRRQAGRRGGLASAQARAQANASALASSKSQPRNETLRNETEREALFFSGSNGSEHPVELSPDTHSASNELTTEDVKRNVREVKALLDNIARPKP